MFHQRNDLKTFCCLLCPPKGKILGDGNGKENGKGTKGKKKKWEREREERKMGKERKENGKGKKWARQGKAHHKQIHLTELPKWSLQTNILLSLTEIH